MEEKSDSIIEESTELLKKFDELTNRVKYQDYMMPFGKYVGRFIADIKIKDKRYFDWALEHVKGDLQRAFMWHARERKDYAIPKR